LHIFIDEPQNIKGWEIAVRNLHDEGFNIFLTGSSSKLLSKEIATSLRGRTLTYMILPFSFKEFLKLKGQKFEIEKLSSKEKSILLSLADEYLEFGGFPEIIIENNNENKLKKVFVFYPHLKVRVCLDFWMLKIAFIHMLKHVVFCAAILT
jgi:hypothetical protein